MRNNSNIIRSSLNQEWIVTFNIKLYSDNFKTCSYILPISNVGIKITGKENKIIQYWLLYITLLFETLNLL